MKKHLTLLGVAAMATAVFAGCSNDEIVESYQGEEISFRTRIETRAQEITTTSQLDKFYVWGDAEGFDVFFLQKGVATRNDAGEGNTYDLRTQDNNKVYWPSGVHNIDFWAYGPTDISVTPNVTLNDKRLEGFAPEANMTEGGKNHKDLIVAHTQATHETSGANVRLDFVHALSGITLDLQSGDKTKIMRLKGAWFVNAMNKGDLYYDENAANQLINWELDDTRATYGVQIADGQVFSSNAFSAITKGTSDLMLIPQDTKKLEFNSDGSTKTEGAYILLLCQILSKHDGVHTGESMVAEGDNTFHYHQLFPENDELLYAFTNEYAYTCVPVDFTWEAGMRYNYKLMFCGTTSGGGIYPPDNLPDLPNVDGITIVPRPDGKNPGSPVLDNPITFTVSVAGWDDTTNDTNLQ